MYRRCTCELSPVVNTSDRSSSVCPVCGQDWFLTHSHETPEPEDPQAYRWVAALQLSLSFSSYQAWLRLQKEGFHGPTQ